MKGLIDLIFKPKAKLYTRQNMCDQTTKLLFGVNFSLIISPLGSNFLRNVQHKF
jgi:hypothetical protein